MVIRDHGQARGLHYEKGNTIQHKERKNFMMERGRFLAVGLIFLFLWLGLNQKGFAEERYSVKEGDSLYRISKIFGVPIKVLKRVNHLERDYLKPNQVLLIPDRKEIQKGETSKHLSGKSEKKLLAKLESYIVRKGDNLYAISKRVGLSVEEIQKINHLQGTALKIGQVLTLAKVGSEETTEEEVDEDVDDSDNSEEPTEEPDEENQQEETFNKPVGKWSSLEERSICVRVVKTFLGVPYRLGGCTLKGIDCSAFVKKIYEIFSIDLPRTAREQLQFGKRVGKNELEEGDLVFFRTHRASGTHVGIYIGNNQFVHASSLKKEVKVDNLDTPYYTKRFLRGVRVKELEKEI
jgi:peptidoglycan endopeptidase LytE